MNAVIACVITPMRIAVVLIVAMGCANHRAQPDDTAPGARPLPGPAAAPVPAPSPMSDPRAEALASQLRAIADGADGIVAATVIHLPSGARASVHGDRRLPMMSVFKLPLALLALRDIDAGRRRFTDAIPLTADELRPGVSPVAEAWQRGEHAPTLEVLLRTVLVDSDNTSGDKLVTLGGGGAALTASLTALGLRDITIAEQEIEISARLRCAGVAPPAGGWTAAAIDRCRVSPAATAAALRHEIATAPNAASTDGLAALLVALDGGRLLSPQRHDWLMNTLAATQTGPARLRAGLPTGTRLAHRTGTGTTHGGVNLATNNVGLVWLPDGSRLAIAVLTAGRGGDEAAREATIAAVARAAYTAFATPGAP
jgi:beta-lactamase class A